MTREDADYSDWGQIEEKNENIIDVLNKIRAEIEQVEINGHIRDVECFNAGINTVLNIIDKYKKVESEGEE